MECQKIMYLLGNTSNQPSNFRKRNWVEINDNSRATYSTNSQIKFKISILKMSLCDYRDAYIHFKGTIAIPNTGTGVDPKNRGKKVIFKNCAPLTDCIHKMNNTQVDEAKDIDVVMPMYSLIEFSDNYSETSESLW